MNNMKKNVAHFLRKNTQIRASFIQNQIINHVDFHPIVISKYNSINNDGGYADDKNLNIRHFNLWENSSIWSKIMYKHFKRILKKDVKVIQQILKKNNIDILHFHFGTDAGVYVPFLKRKNLPVVVSFYGYDYSEFPKKYFGFAKYYLKHRVFPYVDRVLAMTDDMRNDLIKIGCPKHKIVTHYYGTDIDRFSLKHDYKENETIEFLIFSGLAPKKGHFFLLEAFKKAYEEKLNIRLTICGDGPLINQISTFVRRKNMNYVRLIGRVEYGSKDHINYLKNSDVFVHPSVIDKNGDKEGIPGAIVEAMVAGLPVISTYHAGIPYIIEKNITGILVKEWNIEELAEKIILLAQNNNLRKQIGEAGHKYAINNLNLKVKEKELENIYCNLINYEN